MLPSCDLPLVEPIRISAAMLYDYVACEHRPWMRPYASPKDRDTVSPFIELLWRRQRAHEEEAIRNVDVVRLDGIYRSTRTRKRHARSDCNAYSLDLGGRLCVDDPSCRARPVATRNCCYVPGDIDAGAGEEGIDEDAKPKKRYAVQLALYVDVLERLGFSDGKRVAFVLDVNDEDVPYDLMASKRKNALHVALG